MRLLLLALLGAILAGCASTKPASQAPDTRCYEMRVYYAAPGKLEELHARFRNHTIKLFEKHAITNIGYWTPADNTENKLIFVLSYPDRAAREASWKTFGADPEWQAAKKASETNGTLVARMTSTFLSATDFSPAIKASASSPTRTFELRTYTATPGKLPALNARFRDHTVKLFEKHGMTNFAYWNIADNEKGSDTYLIYLLAHKDQAAAKASFDAFRADPLWIAAKAESEVKAGGSLTLGGAAGVKSEFLVPTDYSASK